MDYRQSTSWKGALDLAPGLINLAEALPASEEMGLSFTLRQLMVDLPATVATDLLQGTDTRRPVALKLIATIELIDRVYPALDTATTRAAAEALAEQLTTDAIHEAATPPAPAPESAPDAPAAEPAPEPQPQPTYVAVQPAGPLPEEPNVQPNSVQ
jgi:hypothetical protein